MTPLSSSDHTVAVCEIFSHNAISLQEPARDVKCRACFPRTSFTLCVYNGVVSIQRVEQSEHPIMPTFLSWLPTYSVKDVLVGFFSALAVSTSYRITSFYFLRRLCRPAPNARETLPGAALCCNHTTERSCGLLLTRAN